MRYGRLDNLRGLTFVSMFLYHALWDLVYLYDINIGWYRSTGAYVWQQSICWTYIMLSGFCWSMGKEKFRRGIKVFLSGAAVTLVTLIVMPESPAVFGVLTLLGSCMILWIWPEKWLKNVPPLMGAAASFFLFFLLREVNAGWLGFEKIRLLKLPDGLYRNLFTAYLGFPAPDFSSTDYFSLLPWFFLFVTGYYLFRLTEKTENRALLQGKKIPVLCWIGKHSLLLYLLHQPVLYAVFWLIFEI